MSLRTINWLSIATRGGLIALLIVVVGVHAHVLWQTPLEMGADSIPYLGWSQEIIDTQSLYLTNITFTQDPPIYRFFPGLFELLAIASYTTTLSLPMVAVLINLIMVALLLTTLFFLIKLLFHNELAALLGVLLYATGGDALLFNKAGDAGFLYLSTGSWNLLLFLLASSLGLFAFQTGRRLFLVPLPLLVMTMIIFHHQSSIPYSFILFFFLLIVPLMRARWQTFMGCVVRGIGLAIGLVAIPWALFFALNIHNLKRIFLVGQAVAMGATGGIAASHFSPLIVLGTTILLFAIIGGIGLFASPHHSRETKLFLALLAGITLAGSFQGIVGLHFFEERFRFGLLLPAVCLAGYGLWQCVRQHRFIGIGIVVLVVVSSLGLYLPKIHNLRFYIDWQYLESIVWAREHLDPTTTIIGDTYTVMTFAELGRLRPAYQFPRPTTKNFTENNSLEIMQTTFPEHDPERAHHYLRDHQVGYLIIDTQNSPYWAPGDYTKFSDTRYFTKIYSQKLSGENTLEIYAVNP